MEDVLSRLTVAGLLLVSVSLTNGHDICSNGRICEGSGAYCCRLMGDTIGCCYTYVYQLWWFWMIWIVLFFLVLACSLACWRRRRAQYRYVVMSNSEYPSYGTVIHTRNDTTVSSTPPGYQPNAPPAPPGYPGSEKPPAYSR